MSEKPSWFCVSDIEARPIDKGDQDVLGTGLISGGFLGVNPGVIFELVGTVIEAK